MLLWRRVWAPLFPICLAQRSWVVWKVVMCHTSSVPVLKLKIANIEAFYLRYSSLSRRLLLFWAAYLNGWKEQAELCWMNNCYAEKWFLKKFLLDFGFACLLVVVYIKFWRLQTTTRSAGIPYLLLNRCLFLSIFNYWWLKSWMFKTSAGDTRLLNAQ